MKVSKEELKILVIFMEEMSEELDSVSQKTANMSMALDHNIEEMTKLIEESEDS